MTTIPTPGDLAARLAPTATTRPGPLAVRREGEPGPDQPFRERWEWAVRNSLLHHRTRHVALTVATWADYQTGVIAGHAPGVPRLSAATGMGHITVRKGMHELREAGFLRRTATDSSGTEVDIVLTLPARPR